MKRTSHSRVSRIVYVCCASTLLQPFTEINAACTLTPGAGDDRYVQTVVQAPGLQIWQATAH